MNVLELAQARVQLKKVAGTKGGEYQGPCPQCGGENRFHVWPETEEGEGSWWCRQCDKAGDGIEFLRFFEGMGFKEACQALGKDVPAPPVFASREWDHSAHKGQGRGSTSPGPATASGAWQPDAHPVMPGKVWRERAEAFMTYAYENLMAVKDQVAGVKKIRTWLGKRGLDEYNVKLFRLGWNPEDLFRPRKLWGLPPELKDDGTEKKLWIPGGLVIPYRVQDNVVRLRIRREKDNPRYYVLPGSDMAAMVRQIDAFHRAYMVVESELDAALLDAECIDLVGIVALGNASRKPDSFTWDILRKAERVLISLDQDEAGKKATEWWMANLSTAKKWPVPKGKDPGEAYQAGVNLRAWIEAGLPEGWLIS